MPEIKPLKKSVITAIILFILDVFVFNQGVIAVIALLFVLFGFLPKSLVFYVKKKSPRHLLKKSLIYAVMAVGVWGANYLNNQIARQRAEFLIVKIEAYRADNGNYPLGLEDLVPTYMDSVPFSKYTLGLMKSNLFYYSHNKGSPLFGYVHFPPFGRPMYLFDKKKWTYID